MTRPVALLDVNLLVALFDREHIHHDLAHHWFGENRQSGWATCPLTENGAVRILSHPSYGGRRVPLADAVETVAIFRGSGGHEFWPDSLSILDSTIIEPRHIQGHRQLTDIYLLALSVHHDGRLATLDRSMAIHAVTNATAHHLEVLGS